MTDELIKFISSFDVISFDIFDTLLLRPLMNPQDVWRIVEDEEVAAGFACARRIADAKTYAAATRRGGEHTLDEAYALMGGKWAKFKEKELACERRLLVGNPVMIEVWKRAGELGKKRVIISDMYVDEAWLKKVLLDNGVDGWDGFYLSSKVQKRKSTGELYKVMRQDFGEAKYLHLGDNQWSDVTKAEENGFVAVRCPRVNDLALEAFPFLRAFLTKDLQLERSRTVGALAIGWNEYKYSRANISFWNRIGYMLGGVLGYSYMRWVVSRCKVLGIDHLMFVGRDGYIWQKIISAICPEIRSDYFYAPRTISVRVLGAVLNADYDYVCEDRRRFADEYCTANDEEHALQRYKAYIKKFNIDVKRTALVDGMSSQFSAQRLVEKVVGCELLTFYLMTYSKPKLGESYILSNNRSVSFQPFSEFIFGSPEPPILDVVEEKPVFKDDVDPFEKIRMAVCDEICKGVIECVKTLHRFNVLIQPQDWMAYYDSYVSHLSPDALVNFELARISTDVNHRRYKRIVSSGLTPSVKWWNRGQKLKIFGRHILRMRSFIDNGFMHISLWLFGRIPIMRHVERVYTFADIERRASKC